MALQKAPVTEEKSEAAATRFSRKRVLIAGLALVVAAAAAYFFLLKPTGASAAEPEPEPGEVLTMEPITLNLADGRYLKLGLALQFVLAEGEEEGAKPSGAKAADIAISLLSNREAAELSSGKVREEIKKELVKEVAEAYHDEVMDVYLTEFVMQ